MCKMKELTKSEEQVMQVIWKIGQGFANEIMTAFPEPKPAYNTVLTMVRIVKRKALSGTRRSARRTVTTR